MLQDIDQELKSRMLTTAQEVAGDAVEDIGIEVGEDSADRPAYMISFLINQEKTHQKIGLIYTRLIQKMRDMLISIDDTHWPIVRIFDKQDWGKRHRA